MLVSHLPARQVALCQGLVDELLGRFSGREGLGDRPDRDLSVDGGRHV